MTESRVTIVIVSYNSADVLGESLASVALHAAGARVIVVDNASADGSAEIAQSHPFVTLIRSAENEGFSKANNRALRTALTEFALILNPDARLTASTLPALMVAAERQPEAAALGPRTVFADGRPQVSFGPDLNLWSEFRQRALVLGVKAGEPAALAEWSAASRAERTVDWISGSCLLLRMSVASRVGFFDEGYFLYEEDADLCLRLRKAGSQVLFIPQAEVIHALGTSMTKDALASRAAYDRSHRRYYQRHRGFVERLLLDLLIALKR